MTARPCAVLPLLLAVATLAAGCAGLDLGVGGGELPADGDPTAAAGAGGIVIARGDLLAAIGRDHPELSLSEDAARAAARAGREALAVPAGGSTRWEHPASGIQGSFTALRDYTSAAGSLCREVLPRVIAPSGTFTGSTVACRRVDGRWYVLE
jgi:surface antigen